MTVYRAPVHTHTHANILARSLVPGVCRNAPPLAPPTPLGFYDHAHMQIFSLASLCLGFAELIRTYPLPHRWVFATTHACKYYRPLACAWGLPQCSATRPSHMYYLLRPRTHANILARLHVRTSPLPPRWTLRPRMQQIFSLRNSHTGRRLQFFALLDDWGSPQPPQLPKLSGNLLAYKAVS